MAPRHRPVQRASALDTVIRHRKVARRYVRVPARGARINRWLRRRSAPKEFKTTGDGPRASERLTGWCPLARVRGLPHFAGHARQFTKSARRLALRYRVQDP